MTINSKLKFYDSMLHVRGSLKSLAKDFCDGVLRKGHFPHLFNTIENYGYVGPIPDRKYFDLSSMCNSQRDLDEFEEWYNSFTGDWNFMTELELYCVNDVLVLDKIVENYHATVWNMSARDNDKLTGMSPWFNSTSPAFVSEWTTRRLTEDLEYEGMGDEEKRDRIKELGSDHWVVLKPNEYWFARRALRGGRTEIRNIYHQLSAEDIAAGREIRYQDICSQYPYQQVAHNFPVGAPTVHVWDRRYIPCARHENNKDAKCSCQRKDNDRFVPSIVHETQWSREKILADESFFGIVCVTLEPPKDLFHPVLVTWSADLNKCVASLTREDHTEIVCTSPEFITALKHGYKLIAMHRYDQYNFKTSLWRDLTLKLFVEKLVNSSAKPDEAKLNSICNAYGEKFGQDTADDIRARYNDWGKNPAKKQTAKIMMNSCWGKHCQRPVLPQTKIFGNGDSDAVKLLFDNMAFGNHKLNNATFIGDDTFMYNFTDTGKISPNLHGGYLPAGLFVPAYGRLQLWEQLHKLGDRVLMNDTDSIVYIYDPAKYNIPVGSLLGDWEREGIDTDHGGITKFVGLGPKSYAIKCADGHELIKAKGLSIKMVATNLVNFDSMEKLVLDYLEYGESQPISVPQKTFVWNVTDGMRTLKNQKQLKFNHDDLKGELRQGVLYPFGFSNL